MGRKIRFSWRALAPLAALVLLLASVPAIANHIAEDAGTLSLHLGSDGRYFEYSANASQDQAITNLSGGCLTSITGPYASVTGSDRGPGLVATSIGIKSGGSNGTPCGRVDSSEDLTVTLLGGLKAATVDLDLELKGGAAVKIETYIGTSLGGTFFVRSGSSIVAGQGVDGSSVEKFTATVEGTGNTAIANCKNASDSGPDSGSRDNCYVTVHPNLPFDKIKFTPLSGEMSLEGSGDFGSNRADDTIFYLTNIDGVLGCTSANNTVSISEGTVVGSITRLANADGSLCLLKPFTIDVTENVLTFIPSDVGGQLAAYQAEVNFGPKNGTNPFSSQLEYDQVDDNVDNWEFMPWCLDDPLDNPDFAGSINTSVIPSGHTWCIVSAETGVVDDDDNGTDTVSTTWTVVGIGDPKLR